MNKDVLITISGTQAEYNMEEETREAVEIINPATYFFKDGLHYIFYEEVYEDMAGVTKNKIVLKENEFVEVIKKGVTNSTMSFHCGREGESDYETPFGEMLLAVSTNQLETIIEEEQIRIYIQYELIVNCEPYADCSIVMKISNASLGI